MALIFAVEDDPITMRLLEKALGDRYQVCTIASAEECLMRVEAERPDLFLLDVGLPGMSGFELCSALREIPEMQSAPVIFLSGLVEMDARMRGYEVGAHDFILKPFDIREVKQKIDILLAGVASRTQLEHRLNDSDTLASLILSNLDEYAVLLKYLRELNSCARSQDIAGLTHTMLREYGLTGAVQLRLPGGDYTVDATGSSTPIMVSVVNHVRGMGRIFEFKKHGVYNFDRITLLVDNMPVGNPELCGRLRDHLAIAIETADERLAGLLATESLLRANDSVEEIIIVLQATIAAIAERAHSAQQAGSTILLELADEVRASFSDLGLNMFQEDSLMGMIRLKTQELVMIYNSSADINSTLTDLEQRLQEMQTALQANVRQRPQVVASEPDAGSVSTVELF